MSFTFKVVDGQLVRVPLTPEEQHEVHTWVRGEDGQLVEVYVDTMTPVNPATDTITTNDIKKEKERKNRSKPFNPQIDDIPPGPAPSRIPEPIPDPIIPKETQRTILDYFHSFLDLLVVDPNDFIAKEIGISQHSLGIYLILGGGLLLAISYLGSGNITTSGLLEALISSGVYVMVDGAVYLALLPKTI